MKCNDCGALITAENMTHSMRRDVCDGCWDTRDKLGRGLIVPLFSPEFKEIQRKMAGGRGTAKRYIDRCQAGDHSRNVPKRV
jgi:hypothetical protein